MLDEDQARPFLHDGSCIAVAGPGSGKTRMLIAKAARLVESHGPHAVAVTTFSRAAAAEIAARLARAVGKERAGAVTVGTMHKLSLDLLRASAGVLATARVLDEQSARDLLRRAVLAGGADGRESEALVEAAIARKCGALDIAPRDRDPDLVDAALAEYQRRLREAGALDMNDLVREAVLAIRAGSSPGLSARHLLVDEVQDIDRLQLEWIVEHVARGARLTAVGDDEQSIYAFRGGLGYAGMVELAERTAAVMLMMPCNYRSGRDIVEAAGYLFEGVGERFDKRPVAVRGDPGRVRLRSYADEQSTAIAVVEEIAAWLAADATATAGVIARTNLELDLAEAAAIASGIAVARAGSRGFFKRDQVARFGSLLAVGESSRDHLRFMSALELLPISAPARMAIDRYLERPGAEDLMDRLYDTSVMRSLGKQDATLVREWRDALADYAGALAEAHTDEARSAAIERGGAGLARFVAEGAARRDVLFLTQLVARSRSGGVAARLNALSLAQRAGKARLTLSTAHGSKGLEFGAVWVLGCNDGTFPHADAEEAEERRLLFVAMTRARDQLTLCSVSADPASRFVQQIREGAARSAAGQAPAADSLHPVQVGAGPREVGQDGLDDGAQLRLRIDTHRGLESAHAPQ
jgi:superfamily I DNA/RNA helicase